MAVATASSRTVYKLDTDAPLSRREDRFGESQWDAALQLSWREALSRGAFRYALDGMDTRRTGGRYDFVLLKNPKRFSQRRHPEDITSLQQPFDPDSFNFHKIHHREVLFELVLANKYPKAEEEERHLVVVNVSPIEFGHILIVPPPEKCLPQVLTEESVAVSIAMVAHSAWLKGLVCGCQQPTGLCQCQPPPLARTVPGTGDHDTEPGSLLMPVCYARMEKDVCEYRNGCRTSVM